jgi:hypothetical protein
VMAGVPPVTETAWWFGSLVGFGGGGRTWAGLGGSARYPVPDGLARERNHLLRGGDDGGCERQERVAGGRRGVGGSLAGSLDGF